MQGLGGTVYLGAGAAVMGYSPHNEMIAWHNEHIDFWIMVRWLLSDCVHACFRGVGLGFRPFGGCCASLPYPSTRTHART